MFINTAAGATVATTGDFKLQSKNNLLFNYNNNNNNNNNNRSNGSKNQEHNLKRTTSDSTAHVIDTIRNGSNFCNMNQNNCQPIRRNVVVEMCGNR